MGSHVEGLANRLVVESADWGPLQLTLQHASASIAIGVLRTRSRYPATSSRPDERDPRLAEPSAAIHSSTFATLARARSMST